MLGKLIKNNFKALASRVYPVYIAMAAFGVLMLILMLFDWNGDSGQNVGVGFISKAVASGGLCLTALAGTVVTLVAAIGDFARTMFGREGQLTMSLPVNSSSLLFSKWFSGAFWTLLSYTALCVSLYGSVLYLLDHALKIAESDELYYTVYEFAANTVSRAGAAFGITLPSVTVVFNMFSLLFLTGGLRVCFFVLTVYFGITLAHCRPYNRIGRIGGLVYTLASLAAIHGFAWIISKLVEIYLLIGEDAFTFTLSARQAAKAAAYGVGIFPITSLYIITLCTVVLFLLTAFLLERRADVD